MNTPDTTQSHLLNRLLQRQVAHLEAENAALKLHLARLEVRVTDSTERHYAINHSLADEISRATTEAQSLSVDTERAATHHIQTLHDHHLLLNDSTDDIQREHEQLLQQLQAFYGTVQTVKTQAKRDVALVVRRATHEQELLLRQLAALYDNEGNLNVTVANAYSTAQSVLQQAGEFRGEIGTTLAHTQDRHIARTTPIHDTSRALVVCLHDTRVAIEELRQALEASLASPPLPVAASPTPPPLVPSQQDDRVLETARRAFASQQTAPRETPTAPRPILKPSAEPSTVPTPLLAVQGTRPLLPIGIALMAFVVVVTAMMLWGI